MKEFIINFVIISIAMSAVTLIALLLRRVMKKRFTAFSRYVIWSLIIIRLCLPISFGFLPSLITLPTSAVTEPTITFEQNLTDSRHPSLPTAIGNTVIENKAEDIPAPAPEQTMAVAGNSSNTVNDSKADVYSVILSIWFIMAALFMITSIIDYIISSVKLDRSLKPCSADVTEKYNAVCREIGIRRIPAIYMSDIAGTPMLYGFFKSKVVLPDISYDGADLEGIMRHELVHYRRGDLYFKFLSLLANSLNWFNPLVYIACDMHSRDMELACDEAVLSKREMLQRLDYGESLLHIIARCKSAHKLTTGFNPKKRAVKERFENIISTAKRRKGYLIITLVLLLTVSCSCIIGCVNTDRYNSVPVINELGKNEDENRQQIYDAGVFPVLVKESEEEWKLFYENEKLVLASSDGRCFEYGENELKYPYRHENIYYSADMSVEGELGILNYSVPPAEGSYGRNCIVMVNTENGEILNTLTFDALDIVELHGGNYHDLSPFNTKSYGEYYFESGASLRKDGKYNISVILNTPMGVIVSSSSYDPEANSFDDIHKDNGNSFPFGIYTLDTDYISELSGVSDGAYHVFTDFIDGTITPAQADKLFARMSYDGYGTLRFGNTGLIRSLENGGFSVDIEVTDSDYAEIPIGVHQFSFSDDAIYHSCSNCNGENVNDNEEEKNRQEQGIFHVYKDSWRQESSVWTLVHKDGALILSHGDGRSFEYAKGSYDHEKYKGACAYVNGNYGGLIYWTAQDEIHFLGLDLNDGKILFSYDPTVEEILELHNKDLYVDENDKCMFRGYMYTDGTMIVASVTMTHGDDIEFTVQQDYDTVTDTLSEPRVMTWAVIEEYVSEESE